MIKLSNVLTKNAEGTTAYVLPSGVTTTSQYRAIDLLGYVGALRRSNEPDIFFASLPDRVLRAEDAKQRVEELVTEQDFKEWQDDNA